MTNYQKALEEIRELFRSTGFRKRKNGEWTYTAGEWNILVEGLDNLLTQSAEKIREAVERDMGFVESQEKCMNCGLEVKRSRRKLKTTN